MIHLRQSVKIVLHLQVFGTIAISPLGSDLYCPTQRNLLATEGFEGAWTIPSNYDVYLENDDARKLVEYQEWNVKVYSIDGEVEERYDVEVLFHR